MRVPPNLKYVLLTIAIIAGIVVGSLYLPAIIPGLGKTIINIVLAGMGLLFIFAFIKPMFTFLYARADGLLEVLADKHGMGFHVFAYHINSGGESAGSGTRDILHYYIASETGRLYCRKIYSHTMEIADGRSGWEGYTGFEESVLGSPGFKKSIVTLSGKTGIGLQPGEKIKSTDTDHYIFSLNGKTIELKKYSGMVDEGIIVTCNEQATGQLVWKKKI